MDLPQKNGRNCEKGGVSVTLSETAFSALGWQRFFPATSRRRRDRPLSHRHHLLSLVLWGRVSLVRGRMPLCRSAKAAAAEPPEAHRAPRRRASADVADVTVLEGPGSGDESVI
jgi:hypothetical protein